MKTLNKKFSLHFKSLSIGEHIFNYHITETFFKFFPESVIKKAKIDVKVELTVKNQALVLVFFIKGKAEVQCDVCLDNFYLPISYKTNLFVNFADENSDITDVFDTVTLAFSENEIDLAQHIYEYIHLAMPSKVIHPKDAKGNSTCNVEMLAKLKEYQPKKGLC